jgi:flagellar hook protein FlgE
MMRSLFSGISGLKVHQTKMDVIGNNISNVNTVGFRSSSVNFTDVYYQTTQGASGPNASTGAAGTNAVQIGLGANVAAISVDLSGTGATQRTDRSMDLMINGDAFLIVSSNGSTYFTKSGALDIDANGTLYCTTNGASVLGWQVDESGDIRKDTASSLQLMSPENSYSDPKATSSVTLSGNVDEEDPLVANGASGYPISVSFYDNRGNLCTAKLSLTQINDTDTNKYTVAITDIMGSDGKSILKQQTTDANGNPIYESTEQYIKFNDEELTYTVDEGTGVITFTGTLPELEFNGSSGEFTSVGAAGQDKLNLTLNDSNTANNPYPTTGVNIDFSGLTMYASKATSNIQPSRDDGNAAGSLNGFTIQTDGKIYGVYSNGDSKLLGQIAVATFANPSGLEAVGNSMFAATLNSGEFDGIGVDISEVGKFSIGALEMSNVDLATEFTNMITTQRGFQANSRVITTSDTMLEELVNLKR